MKQFLTEHWGDTASVAGLVVSLVGFVIAIRQASRARTAAQRAEIAANQIRSTIYGFDLLQNLTALTQILSEIVTLHQHGAWQAVAERYVTARRLVVATRAAKFQFSVREKELMTSLLQQLAEMEEKVDGVIMKGNKPPEASRYNKRIRGHQDGITQMTVRVRTILEQKDVD